MRIVAQVFLTYFLVLLLGALWHHLPLGRRAPDLVALSAIYLGLSARDELWPAMAGAVIAGYLADLLMGTPVGLLATTAGVICILGHLVQGRLLVRGTVVTAGFSAAVALVAGTIVLLLRGLGGLPSPGFGRELGALVWSALVTGALGPFVFRLCRRVDARFARTQRERDAALEGLVP